MSPAGLEVAQPPLGGSVGARYRLQQRIGAGGMATLYRARDERLRRDVAVKVIADRLADVPSAVRQFRREAELGARLDHPNIVAILDAGADLRNSSSWSSSTGSMASGLCRGTGVLCRRRLCISSRRSAMRWSTTEATSSTTTSPHATSLSVGGTPRPRSSTSELPPTRVMFAPLGRPTLWARRVRPAGDPQGRQAVSPIGSVRARCGRASVPGRTDDASPQCYRDTTPLATAAPRLYPLAELRPSLPRRFSAAVHHALAVDPDATAVGRGVSGPTSRDADGAACRAGSRRVAPTACEVVGSVTCRATTAPSPKGTLGWMPTKIQIAGALVVMAGFAGLATGSSASSSPVGQPPPEWAANAGAWPAHNHDLVNTRATTQTPINSQTVSKLKVKWRFPFKGAEHLRRLLLDADLPRRHRLPAGPELERLRARPLDRQAQVAARRSTSRASGRTASPSATAASTAPPRRTPSRSTRRPGSALEPQADPQQAARASTWRRSSTTTPS